MSEDVRVIKKYPNRRLYDTRTSSYITLADVKQMVLKHEEFQVIDAKSGDDLTRPILMQIILEEESSGSPMFSADVLSQLIRTYGDAMQGMMGTYLERNVTAFQDMQKSLQAQSQKLYGDGAKVPAEMWTQFMSVQAPMMQGMMSNYIEQSKSLFMQMQDQMQSQAKNVFGVFPFPGAPAANAAGATGDGPDPR